MVYVHNGNGYDGGKESLCKPTTKKNALWNKGKLKKHYEQHGIPEFGTGTSKKYLEMAYNFGIRNSDNIIKVIEKSYVYRYEPLTNNIFVRTLKGGKTKSSYKWDSKADDVVIQTLKKLGKL